MQATDCPQLGVLASTCLEDKGRDAIEVAQQQLARVTLDTWGMKVWHVRVGNDSSILHLICNWTKT
jgi:hypothetical protein